MNLKTQAKVIAIAVASVFGGAVQAADKAPQGSLFVGEITPKLYFFDDFKGPGSDRTQYLETYNTQQALGGGSFRSGGYLDFDLNLVGNDGRRDYFVLQRDGFGAHNHRGSVKANSDALGFAGYYSHFRSASHGFNFLYSPGGGVPGGVDPAYAGNATTGYLSQFNNDTTQTRYRTDRTAYGMSLALKPTLFAARMAALLDYDGYSRDGNRFATWILGNGDVSGAGATAARVLERWRGFDKPIDEKMNRFTFRLSGAPGGFQLAYDGTVEKFDNQARTSVVGDFATSIATLPDGVTASGAVIDPADTLMRSVHFVPDSTLITNNFRFSRNYGSTAVAAGYGMSRLEQDTFSPEQQVAGYDTGKIRTNSAYLTVNSHAIRGIGIEGFVKYNDRKNDSTRSAPGVFDPAAGEELNVRVDRFKKLNYGLAATFRPGVWRSSVSVGWKHEDKDRDLTWSVPTVTSIQPHESLYNEETRSDELFVRWIARPMQGMVLRVTPAYVSSRETGLPSEPEKGVSLKTKLSYADASGTMVSGYYNYKGVKNNDRAFTDSTAAGAPAALTTRQDNDREQQAAGVNLNMPFGEAIKATASLSWIQDDFTSYFLRSNRRRYEGTQNVIFVNFDRSNYDIDTYVFTLGGDWQVSAPLRLNAGYVWSRSKGQTGSGFIQTELSAGGRIDGAIDSAVHGLALGVDYRIDKSIKFKGSYTYDHYKDKVYSSLTGGYQTLMLGVSFGF